MDKINNWWRVTGKLWTLYILLIYLALSPFIKQIPMVASYLPEEKYVIPMIATSLFLMVQIFMSVFKGDDKDISLKKFEDNTEEFKKRLKSAKQIDILCSTSESFYPILKDVFSHQKITCRLLLRQPLKGTDKDKQVKGIEHYSDSYNELKKENSGLNLTVKYCFNTFSRIIILDGVEVYFGFYKVDSGRLKAKDIEMMHAKTGSYFGNFILNIAKNRFDSLWQIGDDELNERDKLVY